MNTRKRIAVALSVVLCVICLVSSFGVTNAFLIDKDKRDNTFKVGATQTTIIEDYTPPEKLEPGVSFPKKPSVKNIGNLPCYIRMRADFSDSRMEELCEPLDINTKDWDFDASDGYYYYKHLVYPEETTSDLFTTVTIRTEKSDHTPVTEEELKNFDILVYAESVQHIDHDGDCTADEYRTIWE